MPSMVLLGHAGSPWSDIISMVAFCKSLQNLPTLQHAIFTDVRVTHAAVLFFFSSHRPWFSYMIVDVDLSECRTLSLRKSDSEELRSRKTWEKTLGSTVTRWKKRAWIPADFMNVWMISWITDGEVFLSIGAQQILSYETFQVFCCRCSNLFQTCCWHQIRHEHKFTRKQWGPWGTLLNILSLVCSIQYIS